MLTLTDAASRKLGEVLAQQAEHGKSWYGLRLMASGGCCSGPQYGMTLAEQAQEGDWEGEFGGVRVLIDPESAPMLSGIHVDYVETAEASGFTIVNPEAAPEARSGGGCGGGCACGGH